MQSILIKLEIIKFFIIIILTHFSWIASLRPKVAQKLKRTDKTQWIGADFKRLMSGLFVPWYGNKKSKSIDLLFLF